MTAGTATARTAAAGTAAAGTAGTATATADAAIAAAAGPSPRWAKPDLPCRSDPDLFFAESPQDVRLAKLLCGICPVRAACLAGALQRGEPWGVWGGALFDRGVVIPDKRPRGRPRKLVAVG